jgi:hypothetical protein
MGPILALKPEGRTLPATSTLLGVETYQGA